MIQLPVGFSAIRWTGEITLIRTLPWILRVNKIYTRNPVTGAGYIGYDRNDLYPSLTTLAANTDYLVDMLAGYLLPDAVTAPAGAFSAFPGYVPATVSTPTTPVVSTGPGFVATATAANDISSGMLVARIQEGLVPYSARTLEYQHYLFGVALNSAVAGGSVNVQRGGYVLIPNYGLPAQGLLFAGDNGNIVANNIGMAFSQVVGRALSTDSFIYQPESITILVPNNLTLSTNGN